jgi:hypothetical protein
MRLEYDRLEEKVDNIPELPEIPDVDLSAYSTSQVISQTYATKSELSTAVPDVTREDTTGSTAMSGSVTSFTTIDSVTTDGKGRVTAVNVKTVDLSEFQPDGVKIEQYGSYADAYAASMSDSNKWCFYPDV